MNNLDLSLNTSTLTINGQTHKLDPLMMRLFEYFISHQQTVISRRTLSETVWQREHVSDDAINRGISRLRKILGGGRNNFIITIPKQGYTFTLPKGTCLNISEEQESQASPQNITTQALTSTPAIEQSALQTKSQEKMTQLGIVIKNKWHQWLNKLPLKLNAA